METEASLHLPEGVLNVTPSITSKHGGTTTEVFIGRFNVCEYCGEEVISNGNTRTVRNIPSDPQARFQFQPTIEVEEFTAYACCPPGHTRYIHAQGYCCCPTGLYRAFVEKGRGNPS